MSVSALAVRRPVATAMVFCALTVIGFFSLRELQVDLFPKIDFPSISVVTSYSGVAPEEMETLVTRPVEAAIARVEGIRQINSSSTEGRSRVSLRFAWGQNLEVAVNDVRAALDRTRAQLPVDSDAPVIFKFDLSNFPVMNLAVESDMTEGRLRTFIDDVAIPRLERLEGVAAVEVRGARKREIRLEVDPERMASMGVGLQDVTTALRSQNLSVPAGIVEDGRENVLVRAMGEFRSLEEIAQTPVAWRAGRPLRIADIAVVVDDFEDFNNIVRINGRRGVQLVVTASPDANTISVADMLYDEIARFNRDYEGTARLEVVVDSSTFIRRSIEGVQRAVMWGAALALLVLLFFLQSLRSTIVIGISIPISMLAAFFLMLQLDLTFNLISFGGLAIGVGMLVDNAIVILENIFRQRELGADPEGGAIEGAREVSSAIVASTMTTLCVFVPVVFLGGFAAVFFQEMALVVVSALLCSLLIALTLVPVLSSVLLRGEVTPSEGQNNPIKRMLLALERAYAGFVGWTLRWPWLVLLLCGIALGAALSQAGNIGQELLPEGDEGELRISAEYPVGTRFAVTLEATQIIERIVAEHVPEAANVMATLGAQGFWSNSGEESVNMRVNLIPHGERARTTEEIATDLRPRFAMELPGMRTFTRSGGGLWIFSFIRGGDDRVRVEVRGYDLETSRRLAEEVAEGLRTIPGVSDARASRREGGRELQLFVDRERAADAGLSAQQVAQAISTLVQGSRAGFFREGGDEFVLRVKLNEADLRSLERVLETPITVRPGRTIPLRDLVDVQPGRTPLSIDRRNQERVIDVSAGLDGTRTLGEVNLDVREAIGALEVPDDFALIVAGEAQEQDETFGGLWLGVILALLLVYMVMAGQFESFVQPFVIMLSIPFAAIGVVSAMLSFDTTLNINSFMGLIVLVGIVVNNAIVLIDYMNMLRREQGMSLREAVVDGARRRLRPILMTTTTTILALLPVALATGPGSENQGPLAQVVVGGLFSTTLVTLVLIPLLYYASETAMERLRSRPAPAAQGPA